MIQIHPKRAFLNSDVVISNKGNETVVLKDSLTGETFSLSPGEYRSSTYRAGEHTISIMTMSGSSFIDSFFVEDALKFGGSVRKNCYVFDGNPWAIIVMRDRTYFFNERTREQFIEHNLSPDSIVEVSPDYLLFTTSKDCSFFSLKTMAFEKTISSSECVYSGHGHSVLSYNGGLYLYRLDSQFKGNRLESIRCNEYVIDEIEGIVYVSDKDDLSKVSAIRLLSSPENDKYEQITNMEIDGRFVCFLNCHTILYTKSSLESCEPNILYSKNLPHLGSSSLIYSGDQPIFIINGKHVMDSNSYDKLCEKHNKYPSVSGEGSKLILDVIENSNTNCYIKTVLSITVKDREAVKTISSRLFFQGTLLGVDNSKQLTFINKGNVDYVLCDKATILFFEGKYYKASGNVVFTKFNDPYISYVLSGRTYFTSLDGSLIKCNVDKSQPEYGLFFSLGSNGPHYYWLKTKKQYAGASVEVVNGVVTVSGGSSNVPPRFFLGDGDIVPVPKSNDDMIAYSPTMKSILYDKGGYYSFARYIDKKWNYTENLVISIYDTVNVKDAIFCSDGESFIYQRDKEMVLFDFNTNEETVFSSDTGIKYNVNGYRPYCTKDFFSHPLMIDPLTHRVVDNTFLNQYRFSNIDGTVYYEKRIKKYILKEDDTEISEFKYRCLLAEYEYPFGASKETVDSIREKRKKYLLDRLGRKQIMSHELMFGGFVDTYIVNSVEFVVVNRFGTHVEIRVGSPLYYLNYVAFSPDSKKVTICGKYRDASGLCLVYDFLNGKVLHRSTSDVGKTMAIWLGLFSKGGDIAYYDSTPNTFIIREGQEISEIQGRSFLTFSPSGKYIALSRQGYTPYQCDDMFWGHVPSCDVYIAGIDNPGKCLCHFNDHGSGIVGLSCMRETIASASFSNNDKRILTVSKDGVVVVRNLHLEG
jgi:hypothetical protein